ncbi:fumarylacetoacetate hydrolase family protein [Plantactinospora sp. WMMB334]|uniref:fumarylacetoacetate hydrolase family protein n=1 Tax=Plantactinospora sp. WMMB334 TaxID=3404119 RepID=UPI003B9332D8
MRLARIETPDGHEIFVSHDGIWRRLSDIEGFAAPRRLVDLLDDSVRRELVGLLGRSPAAGRADIRLAGAATVLDSGDIWGAGLNYRNHSRDLDAEQPVSGPGSYLRPRNCLIANGRPIELPTRSKRVTAEAELGLVIGRDCKNVPRSSWRSVVVGVTAVLDLTAEDVIRENPRYIPWAKGFDTFCSVGPQLVTLDEFDDVSLKSIRVSTVRNGEVIATALTSDMKYDLGYLVEYFTADRTIPAGTVICTGTPGAAVVRPGDSIEAIVEGVGALLHPVA